MQSFSIKEAIRFGWTTFVRDWKIYVGATAFLIVVSWLTGMLAENAGPAALLVNIAATLLMWWLYLGYTRMTLSAHAGQPIAFSVLFGEKWDVLWRYALAAILTAVLVIVGLVLLVVPGIIVQVMLSFVVFTVMDKGMKPIEALKESRRLTKGHRWNVFWLLLALIVLNIAGAVPFFLGLLITVPLSLLALVHVYKELDKLDDVKPAPVAQNPAPAPVQTTA